MMISNSSSGHAKEKEREREKPSWAKNDQSKEGKIVQRERGSRSLMEIKGDEVAYISQGGVNSRGRKRKTATGMRWENEGTYEIAKEDAEERAEEDTVEDTEEATEKVMEEVINELAKGASYESEKSLEEFEHKEKVNNGRERNRRERKRRKKKGSNTSSKKTSLSNDLLEFLLPSEEEKPNGELRSDVLNIRSVSHDKETTHSVESMKNKNEFNLFSTHHGRRNKGKAVVRGGAAVTIADVGGVKGDEDIGESKDDPNISIKLEAMSSLDKQLFLPSSMECPNCSHYLKALTTRNYMHFSSMSEYINEGESSLLVLKNKKIDDLENRNKIMTQKMKRMKKKQTLLSGKLKKFSSTLSELNANFDKLMEENKLLKRINADLMKSPKGREAPSSHHRKKPHEGDFENSIDKELFNEF
ncbi:conserved Plasmodium protein, unknown function [Plasmodium ovale]|nr:conserved Plasmodium protein, unknown function [Plasmodium ovale]